MGADLFGHGSAHSQHAPASPHIMLGKGKEASEAEPSAESRSASLDSSALPPMDRTGRVGGLKTAMSLVGS